MIYIASPYSDPDPTVRARRFELVRSYTIERIQAGECVFSPIMYLHEAAIEYKLPTEMAFWLDFCKQTINSCKSLRVLCLDGWRQSVGIQDEIGIAITLNKPVSFVNYMYGSVYIKELK